MQNLDHALHLNPGSRRKTAWGLFLILGLGSSAGSLGASETTPPRAPYLVEVRAKMPEDRARPAPTPEAMLPLRPSLDAAYFGENQGLREMELLKRPVPDPEGRRFQDWIFTLGHATYKLTGKATYFRSDGVIRGFYFAGAGLVDYASMDAVEFPVVRRMLELHTAIKPGLEGKALHIRDELNEGLFWFAGMAVPDMPGTVIPASAAKILSRSSLLLDRDQEPFQQELAKRVLGSTDKPFVRVQFRGRDRFWQHTVDQQDAENLRVNQITTRDHYFYWPTVLISQQPITWSHKAPKLPGFALTAMDLDVRATNAFGGSIRVVQTFTPLQDGLKVLDLNLPNRFAAEGLHGPTTLRLKVSSVSDADGNALAFDHANGGLLVAVPGMKKQVPVTLFIQMEGEMFGALSAGGRDSGWIPMPKEQAAKVFTLKFHGQAKKPWMFFGAGDNTRIWADEDSNHVEIHFDKPVESFRAEVARYAIQQKVETETVQDLTFTRLREPGVLRQEGRHQDYDALLGHEIQTLEQLLGPAPFTQLFETASLDARPGRFGMTSFQLEGNAGARSDTSPGVYSGRISSLAAQYWGQVVKPWNAEDAWLLQALPLYCGVLAEKNWVRDGQLQFQQSLAEWFRRAERAKDAGAIATASRIRMEGGFVTSREAFSPKDLTSSKGVCLLYTLHQELGDELFSAFLKTCLSTASYQPFSTASMPLILKQLTGKDYEPFFDKYFWGTEVLQRPVNLSAMK